MVQTYTVPFLLTDWLDGFAFGSRLPGASGDGARRRPSRCGTTGSTAAVSLGDSYIAGEGGRWEGNSTTDWGDRRGTDRAAYRRGWFWRYDQELIYGDSYDTGCHRSDVAPIHSADLNVDAVFNLACSGASTINVISSASGGQAYRGEAPQVDQLAAVAATHDVEVVVISVSGNDLGFTDVILDCVLGYTTSTRWNPNTCYQDQQANLVAELPDAMAGVATVLADVQSVLSANGDADARVILQSYPSPVPESSNIRYRETGWDRTFRGGCPFWDADLDWANGSLIPTLTDGLQAEAVSAGVEFLDLSQSMKGHEACAETARQGASAVDGEWLRFLTTGLRQGDAEESLHPNAFGQRAIGECLALVVAEGSGSDVCINTTGSGPEEMRLN